MTDDVDSPTVVGTPLGGAAPAVAVSGEPPPVPPDDGGRGGDGGDGSGPLDGSEPGGDGTAPAPGAKARRGINRSVVEWVALILAAVVIAIVIKSFLFQAFYIPSASMEPTLMIGDRVLVNKLSYDLHDVHRGDIVVFASGPNTEWHKAGIDDLVKRVIGLPGETVTQCEGQQVCIDGRLLKEPYLPKETQNASVFPATIPGCAANSPANGCTVPPGKIFVMGDNRTNSQDARANGPVKESSIVGRVFVRIWPLNRLGTL